MQQRQLKKQQNSRRGGAVVELAAILPVIFLITIGTLETCEGIFLRQKVEVAAHEGARLAIVKRATLADVRDSVADYLESRGIVVGDINAAVTVDPAPENAAELVPITVTVRVDFDSNTRMPIGLYRYFNGGEAVGEVTMYKEFSVLPD